MDSEVTIVGQWIRERVLGTGTFGIVSLWRNVATNEKIAVKKCRLDLEANLTQENRIRWCEEVDMISNINNANIVKYQPLPDCLKSAFAQLDGPYRLPVLSMEYCTQGDLRQVLLRPENCCGLLELDVRNILSDVKNALEYLHKYNVTHRDLKPENVVLQYCDNRFSGIVYKLIDLGYAKQFGSLNGSCMTVVGTLQYLAPELMYGKSYTKAVDYWSFGTLAFEIMCGVRPFLPNFTPSQWLDAIKNKSPDHIRAYETPNGLVQFSEHIFPENHLVSTFRTDIECWLKIALDLDPKTRGFRGSVRIFDYLDEVLRKQSVTVFSVFTYEFQSYEIDASMTIADLMLGISIDVKIPVELLEIVCFNGNSVTLTGKVFDYYEADTSSPHFYVYHTQKHFDVMRDNIPRLPLQVKSLLENSTRPLTRYHRRRAHAVSLYFVFQETCLYNTLLEACNVRLKNIINQFDDVDENIIKRMDRIRAELNAQIEIMCEINDVSEEKCQPEAFEIFNEKRRELLVRFDKITEAVNSIQSRFNSAKKRCLRMNEEFFEMFSKDREHELNLTLEQALECYSQVKNSSKRDKITSDSCCTMAKIIFSCLKYRDQLIKDSTFQQYLIHITDAINEFRKITSSSDLAINHLNKIKHEHTTLQRNHQVELLQTLQALERIDLASNQSSTRNSMVNGHETRSESDRGENITRRDVKSEQEE